MERAKIQEKREAANALQHNIDWIEDVTVKHVARDDLLAIQSEKARKQELRKVSLKKQRQKQRMAEKD